jgi:hypothetical protein
MPGRGRPDGRHRIRPGLPDPTPPAGDDARFTFGLLRDVTEVLAAHGYPPVRTGVDLVRFQQALFTAIYHPEGTR